jgi:hypothetical protein
MKSLALNPALNLNQLSGQGAAATRGLRPRLRRWLRKLRQYGRFQIDLDLRGLLYLGAVFGLVLPLAPLGHGLAAAL